MDRRLIIITLLLGIYVFAVKPLNNKTQIKLFELRNIEKAIAKEKFVEKQAEKIKRIYPLQMKVARKNQERFFAYGVSTSSAMSMIQSIISKQAKTNAIKLTNINWGVTEDMGDYIRLPIVFSMTGYPDGVSKFIRAILSQKKLLRFKMFSVSKTAATLTKTNRMLIVRGVIIGYKLKRRID